MKKIIKPLEKYKTALENISLLWYNILVSNFFGGTSMNIKKGFVIEKVGDSYLACATGKLASSFSGFVKLNETGAFLWKLIASGKANDVEALVSALVSEYDVSEDIAVKDVSAFVDRLSASGILEG